ncbi:hypothetical protein RYH80_04650 [Halobaculum sp. MBLA0147]|uniref:hypothetical protein n=1 Tax=Halobaculum sp. MBLA0147 TaxID=3079934 RepID=UPI003524CB4B
MSWLRRHTELLVLCLAVWNLLWRPLVDTTTRLVLDPAVLKTLSVFVPQVFGPVRGFLLLVGVVALSRLWQLRDPEREPISWSVLVIVTTSTLYSATMIYIWVDQGGFIFAIYGGLETVTNWLFLLPVELYWISIPINQSVTELVELIADLLKPLQPSVVVPQRWPSYLLVAYVGSTRISGRSKWPLTEPRTVRLSVWLTSATAVLVYGLLISSYFFTTNPIEDSTFILWSVVNVVAAASVVSILRSSVGGVDWPPVSTMLVVWISLGVLIAVVDALYPLPEVLLIVGVAVSVLERATNVKWATKLKRRALDLENQIVTTLSLAWSEPSRLFSFALVLEGLRSIGWIVWLLFASEPVLSGERSVAVTVLALTVSVPILSAAAYVGLFWFSEVERLKRTWSRGDRRPRGTPRPPDLLITPTITLVGVLTVAVGVLTGGVLAAVLGFGAMIVGSSGMLLVIRERNRTVQLPSIVSRHSTLFAFLVYFTGLSAASLPSNGVVGNRFAIRLVNFVPLYAYPVVRESGIGPLRPTVAGTLLVGAAIAGTAFLTTSLGHVAGNPIGVGALLLAVSLVWSDVRDRWTEHH